MLIIDFDKINRNLIFSFEKIENLSEDLFCTGDISNNDEWIKTFKQFINNEPFDFFGFGEIKEIMDLKHMELIIFKKLLEDLIEICPFFIIKKHKIKK